MNTYQIVLSLLAILFSINVAYNFYKLNKCSFGEFDELSWTTSLYVGIVMGLCVSIFASFILN